MWLMLIALSRDNRSKYFYLVLRCVLYMALEESTIVCSLDLATKAAGNTLVTIIFFVDKNIHMARSLVGFVKIYYNVIQDSQ